MVVTGSCSKPSQSPLCKHTPQSKFRTAQAERSTECLWSEPASTAKSRGEGSGIVAAMIPGRDLLNEASNKGAKKASDVDGERSGGLEKGVQSFFMNQAECEGRKHLSLQFPLLCFACADQSLSSVSAKQIMEFTLSFPAGILRTKSQVK